MKSLRVIISASLIVFGISSRLEAQATDSSAPNDGSLELAAGKSLVFDSAARIQRVSIANPAVAEAVVVNPQELLVHGKAPGDTSLVIWLESGRRRVFDLSVHPESRKLEAVRRELRKELPGQEITLSFEGNTAFLRGTVHDAVGAQRAASIAAVMGKTVNLLNVEVPETEPQILLRVRFANVDRTVSHELGFNFFSTGAGNTVGRVTTGQFSPGNVDPQTGTLSLSDALNILLFRRDINLGATIHALQSRRLLEILAEPNLLTINGQKASFLAGGEFPYPVLQSGSSSNAITIQFREFGIRITFLPTMTPRGTIRLHVQPEVSSLDFANALTIQGFNIPALSTRKVETEIELESGQSFAIAGLLDNRVAETLNKVPGISNIPVLGKLFQSRAQSKTDTELLVVVTPELVQAVPTGQPAPSLSMPEEFLKGATPRMQDSASGTLPAATPLSPRKTVPVETLIETQKSGESSPSAPTTFTPQALRQAPAGSAGPPAAPASPAADATQPVRTPVAESKSDQ